MTQAKPAIVTAGPQGLKGPISDVSRLTEMVNPALGWKLKRRDAFSLIQVRIGQLSTVTGIPARTIRFYEQSGLLPAPARTPAGYRDYDASAVSRLRFIRAAQSLDLSLAEIAEVLRIRDEGPPCGYVADLLTGHLERVERRIAELIALRDELRRRIPPAAPDPDRNRSDQVT
jgi:MerR family transcriptional regulator, copper efflux regulator